MIRSFLLALAQMGDPAFRRAAFGCFLLTLLVLFAIGIPIVWGASLLGEVGFEHAGGTSPGWERFARYASGTLGAVAAVVLGLVLFITLSTAIYALFLDRIVVAVYARHAPGISPGSDLPILRSLGISIRFLLVTVFLNLLALPLYILFLFFPLLDMALYGLLNGYLFGREYFELVALRHLDNRSAAQMRRSHRGKLWIWGTIVSILFLIPILNFFAPLLSAAAMVHLYRDMESSAT